MRNKFLLGIFPLFLLLVFNAAAQSDCSSAIVVCGNTQPFNPSGVGTKLEQLACGGIEHNSVWVAFQAKANGKLNFVIRPFTLDGLPALTDVDWSLYSLAGAPGTTNCDAKTQLSCNFAGTSTVFGIPGATGLATPNFTASQFNPGIDVTSGNWYVIIIDQFSNTTPLLFSVQFTGNPEFPALNSSPGIFDNKPDFTVTNTSGCGGSYSFTNSAVATSGIAGYSWNFGDGSTSTLPNPGHTYITPGTYYVTLTVTNNNGCKSDIRKTVIYNNTAPAVNTAGILLTASCSDSNNGTLTVVTSGATTLGVSGGTAPYTFELVSPSPMIRAAQPSNVFTGLQPGAYTVKVTDACGKSAINVVTISQVATNSTIGLGIQNIQAACMGTATGTATLFANGSVPPYTMSLVNSSPVIQGPFPSLQRDPITATYYTTFTNLLPGLYTLEATDGCGKLRRATFTVSASTSPVANAVASPSCASTATGTITVSATAATGLSSNGSPGIFQYALIAPSPEIRGFQNSSVFENLFSGTYTIAVKDVCGNIGTSTVTVGVATAPNFGTSFTSLSCPNGSTGTIEVQNGTTAGGGSPYTYELLPPSPVSRPAQNNNAFNNLPPGTYTVRLKDVCGTAATATVNVGAATAPTFTATTLSTGCASSSSGSLVIAPAATTIGPYGFELISPGPAIRPVQGSNIANTTSSIFTNLNAGTYTVRMTDGCGVKVTNTTTISAPVALAFPAGSTSVPSCTAGSTGMITVAVPATGLGAYKYELIAPSPVTRAPQYSRIFNNVPTGNYVIRITDSCGTQIDNSATPLAVAAATAPTLTVTNSASCATATGTITCSSPAANQGGGTYLYALIAPSPVTRPNQSAPIFTGLPAGAYTVQITDQCGLTGTVTTTIAAAGAFTPAVGGSTASCSGIGYIGQIVVTNPQNYTPGGPIPTGSGGGNYTFTLYDATNTILIAGPQASNLFSTVTPLAGTPTHTIRVTDVCGNTSTTTATINPPAALTNATIVATTPSCAAGNTGVIKISVQSGGGLPPLTYALLDAVTSAVVAGPQSGTSFNGVPANATGYLVKTTDACGNSTINPTALLFPAAVAPTATVVTTASCAGSSTGSIVVTPGIGATLAGGTFSYALYDAANTVIQRAAQPSPVFSNVAAGSYTVRIIDRCGTDGTVSAIIASGVTAPTAAGTVSGTCSGGASGVITSSSTGGSLPITYTLSDQVTSTVIAGPQANNIFSGLSAGTYIVTVTDACGTLTASTNIVVGDLIATPTISTTSAIDCIGTAIIAAYGGGGSGGPYTYAMCSGSGCTSFGAYSSSSTFSISASGTYRLSVKDRCGNATSSADIVINIPTKAVVTGVTKAGNCGATTITVSASNAPNTPYYSVDGVNFGPTNSVVNTGCHNVRVSDFNAGFFGCASDAFNFSVYALPTLQPVTASDVNCINGEVTVTTNIAGGSLGCTGSGAAFGIKLSACTGCSGAADAVGTIKSGPTATFNLSGATAASFAPVVTESAVEQCAGSGINLDFIANFCGGTPLPIRLEYFRGFKNGSSNDLDWKVTCTGNTDAHMTLERSGNGRNFSAIYTLNATAVRCLQPFSHPDESPLNGINYYRLKMTDANGKAGYSNIVALVNPNRGFNLVSIQPNPVKKADEAGLVINSLVQDAVEIVLTDLSGRKLSTQHAVIAAGKNIISLKVSALAGGSYLVTVYSKKGGSTTVRFVKE